MVKHTNKSAKPSKRVKPVPSSEFDVKHHESFPSGKLRYEQRYINADKTGGFVETHYHASGHKNKTYMYNSNGMKHGVQKVYCKGEELPCITATWVNGDLDGPQTRWCGDKKVMEHTWRPRAMIKRVKKLGAPGRQVRLNGVAKYWHPNGQLAFRGFYRDYAPFVDATHPFETWYSTGERRLLQTDTRRQKWDKHGVQIENVSPLPKPYIQARPNIYSKTMQGRFRFLEHDSLCGMNGRECYCVKNGGSYPSRSINLVHYVHGNTITPRVSSSPSRLTDDNMM